MATIYGLVDPRSGQVRYVGRTTVDLPVRLVGHLSQRSGKARAAWIAKLKKLGLRPGIVPLERRVAWYDGPDREREWVRRFGGIVGLLNERYSYGSPKWGRSAHRSWGEIRRGKPGPADRKEKKPSR